MANKRVEKLRVNNILKSFFYLSILTDLDFVRKRYPRELKVGRRDRRGTLFTKQGGIDHSLRVPEEKVSCLEVMVSQVDQGSACLINSQ